MVLPLCLGDGMKMLYLSILTVKYGVSRGVNDQIRSSRLAHISCSKHTYSEAKPIGITTTKNAHLDLSHSIDRMVHRQVYFAQFRFIISYDVIFWGNTTDFIRVLRWQKKLDWCHRLHPDNPVRNISKHCEFFLSLLCSFFIVCYFLNLIQKGFSVWTLSTTT